MLKKSQLSIFVIIGLVIILASLLILWKGRRPAGSSPGYDSLILEKEKFSANVQDCMEQTMKRGISTLGLLGSEHALERFVDEHILACISFDSFRKRGLIFSQAPLSSKIEIQYAFVSLELSYPISIRLGDNSAQFTSFSFVIKRNLYIDLPVDLIKDRSYVLPNHDGNLKIKKGTQILNGGNFISIRLQGSAVTDPTVVGGIAYSIKPLSVTFSQPVELEIDLDGKPLPENAETLAIAYFHKPTLTWIPLPTQRQGTKLTAKVTGLSTFAPIVLKEGRLDSPKCGGAVCSRFCSLENEENCPTRCRCEHGCSELVGQEYWCDTSMDIASECDQGQNSGVACKREGKEGVCVTCTYSDCNDSDGYHDPDTQYRTRGTCRDARGIFDDTCEEGRVKEYYCTTFFNEKLCDFRYIYCDDCTKMCA